MCAELKYRMFCMLLLYFELGNRKFLCTIIFCSDRLQDYEAQNIRVQHLISYQKGLLLITYLCLKIDLHFILRHLTYMTFYRLKISRLKFYEWLDFHSKTFNYYYWIFFIDSITGLYSIVVKKDMAIFKFAFI